MTQAFSRCPGLTNIENLYHDLFHGQRLNIWDVLQVLNAGYDAQAAGQDPREPMKRRFAELQKEKNQ